MLCFVGHGTKLRDENGDEGDGYDEALVPLDFQEGAGMIRDDDLYDTLIEPLAPGVHMVSLVSECQWKKNKLAKHLGEILYMQMMLTNTRSSLRHHFSL